MCLHCNLLRYFLFSLYPAFRLLCPRFQRDCFIVTYQPTVVFFARFWTTSRCFMSQYFSMQSTEVPLKWHILVIVDTGKPFGGNIYIYNMCGLIYPCSTIFVTSYFSETQLSKIKRFGKN